MLSNPSSPYQRPQAAELRRLFELACRYSGQILSYTKTRGQLQDVGNTTTLAHYLDLLSGARMVRGLQKLVGGDGITLDEFLARPVSHWIQA
jgi:predicted AAA+ superfamily ATPase